VKISINDVEHVADLARLHLDEKEKEQLAGQLSSVLDYIDMLNELDTKDVPPTTLAVFIDNVFRSDEVGQSLTNEVALANAPDKKDGFFRVPTII
jgi:aspartyl-tRNA(Asn)/glutamyl-tRNA(Gln) amidotransferase subunit C